VRICSVKSLERIIEPTIADLQREFADGGTSRWRSIRRLSSNYLAVLWVIGICTLGGSEATAEERDNIRRMLFWACLSTGVVTILLTLPPLSLYPEVRGWHAFLTVVPQALPLAIPFGVVFAIVITLSATASARMTKAIVLLSFVASLLSFATLAWLMPAGNQAFRELAFAVESKRRALPVTPSKGPAELTFVELRREIDFAEGTGQRRRARRYSWMFHLRFTLAAAVMAIAVFMVVVPVNRRLFRGLLALAVCFVYWVLMYTGQLAMLGGYLSPFAGAWLPNVTFVAAALFMSSRSRYLRPAGQG
jgi:lipopolysaccharide export LptBFGC system permease protein LptF